MQGNLLLNLLVLTSILIGGVGLAQAVEPAASQQSDSPAVLCMPGIYMSDPGDCIPTGPSAYLTQLAHQGITLPVQPLPATPIDPVLAQVDTSYAEVISDNDISGGSCQTQKSHEKAQGNEKA